MERDKEMTGMPTTGKAAILRLHIFSPRQKGAGLSKLCHAKAEDPAQLVW